jgi:iron(II)-dependent oxidoreductase
MGFIGDPRLTAQDRWVQIPGGSSLLGSESQEAWPQERPVREVKLSEYWIQRWPVTVGEFASFVDDARGYEDDRWWDEAGLQWRNSNEIKAPDDWDRLRVLGNRPVTGVGWWEARAYTLWLNTNTVRQLPENWSVTLPTEAQWERAARGPYDSPVHHAGRFPWGPEWDDDVERANCDRLPFNVCPVGLFAHGYSAEGVWDLAGNISELCLDGFGPPNAAEGADPYHTDYRHGHSLRGGDWASPILNARVSARFPDLMSKRSDHRVGFRCVAWLAPDTLR